MLYVGTRCGLAWNMSVVDGRAQEDLSKNGKGDTTALLRNGFQWQACVSEPDVALELVLSDSELRFLGLL